MEDNAIQLLGIRYPTTLITPTSSSFVLPEIDKLMQTSPTFSFFTLSGQLSIKDAPGWAPFGKTKLIFYIFAETLT